MLLTVKQAAKKLNISPSTVYQLINSGELVHLRLGAKKGAIRISEESLTEYQQSCLSKSEKRQERPKKPRPVLKHLKL